MNNIKELKKKEIRLFGGGRITYIENFLTEDECNELIKHMDNDIPWVQRTKTIGDRIIKTPRLLWAMRNSERNITNVYTATESSEWTDKIKEVKGKIEKETNFIFEYAQMNRYRNGDDYIGFHSDNEVKDGDIIASLSLGATRRFLFKNKNIPSRNYEMFLKGGSLLIMDDDAGKNKWKHCLPKMKHAGERFNITFRPK
jgi:alkylated DNA repair dioxygenase AlkB